MAGKGYYDRTAKVYVDGTNIFMTEEDARNENQVAGAVGIAWGCEFIRYADLSPIDWYIRREGRIVGFAELKCRAHATTRYPTVFLNHRKYIGLMIARLSGPPAIFVVRFEDGIRWIRVTDVDPSRMILGGCKTKYWKESDIEPVIEVPVADMLKVKGI